MNVDSVAPHTDAERKVDAPDRDARALDKELTVRAIANAKNAIARSKKTLRAIKTAVKKD